MRIERQVPLKLLTTFRIGGPADYFCTATNLEELKEAVRFAKKRRLPVRLLGGGSNMLVSDRGVRGLLIKVDLRGRRFTPKAGGAVEVVSAAGEEWDDLVRETVRRKLWGIENLSGIPGSVGAAPIQNIGAYGVEFSHVLTWVEALNRRTLHLKRFVNAACQFSYRDSFFKSGAGKPYLITRVCLQLSRKPTARLHYRDLREFFSARGTGQKLFEIRRAVIAIRKRKFPSLEAVGTAGSFFKNPIISPRHFVRLKKKFSELPGFPVEGGVKVPLAWVLDHILNLRGFRRGKAGLSVAHPLVVLNFGGATATEVAALARDVSKKVKRATDIEIEWEVVFVK